MLRHKLTCIAAALAILLWLGATAQSGGGKPGGRPGGGKPGGGKPTGSSAPRVTGGGARPAIQSAPRVTSGGTKPAIQSAPRVTGGGTKPAAGSVPSVAGGGKGDRPSSFKPPAQAVKGQRPVPAATANLKALQRTRLADRSDWGHHHHHHHSRHTSLFLFGLGSPFGFYSNCLPAYLFGGPRYSFGYGHSFAYSPLGCGWIPGLYGAGSYPDVYDFPPAAEAPPVAPPAEPEQENVPQESQFAKQAARDFAGRQYDSAARHWRHALIEDPRNPHLVLLLAQALLQTGNYEEAAGAVQYGLSLLPREQWNTAVPDFTSLYRDNIFDYSARLRDLEKARLQKADNPGLRFLLGYHYSFLGFAEEALSELDAVLKLAPTDEIARKLREMAAAKGKQSS